MEASTGGSPEIVNVARLEVAGIFLCWHFLGGSPAIEAEALSPLFFGFCQLSICIEDITKLLFWLVRILSRRSGYCCRFHLWAC